MPRPHSPHDGAIAFAYRHLLHRDPTPDEVSDWSVEMGKGLSFDVFVDLVSASDEASAVSEAELDASASAVGNMFCFALGRNPTPSDVAAWTDQMRRGRSIASYVDEILDSPEARGRSVAPDDRSVDDAIVFVYRHALAREPVEAELRLWAKHLRDGMSFPKFLSEVVTSEEGRLRATATAEPPSPDAIGFVYRYALGREASDADVRIWTDHLNGGVPFQRFVLDVAASEDGRRHLQTEIEPPSADAITFVYRHALGRKPSDADLAEWSGSLASDVSFQRFLLDILASEEAQAHAAAQVRDDTISDGLFVAHLFEICLGRCAMPAQIEDWKRRMVEHGYRRSDLAMSFIDAAIGEAEGRGEAGPGHETGRVPIMGTSRVLTAEAWAARAAEIDAGLNLAPPAAVSAPYVVRSHTIRVSAIASLYKGGRYIRKFLDNMTRQSLGENFELIIIDADSPDGERDVIEGYHGAFPNIRYERMNYRIGIYDAWNVGVELSRGDYLTNTNLDDLRRSDSLELQARTLDAVPFADVVYQDFFYSLDPELSFEQVEAFGFRSSLPIVTANNLPAYNSPHNAPMWRKRLHAEVGPFDTSLKSAGDHDFWLRCMLAGKTFYKINTPHVVYYQNPDGISTRPGSLGLVEGQRILRKYGRRLFSPDIYLDDAAVSAKLSALSGAEAAVLDGEHAHGAVQRVILSFADRHALPHAAGARTVKILVDAVLFQFAPPGTAAFSLCADVLREMVGLAEARAIGLTVLDRGGLPPLGRVEVIEFPSYHAADPVADATMLQSMAECVGADVVVSTALTMPLLLPAVQLLCSGDEPVPGRDTMSGMTECEIVVACSSAQVCASATMENAFRSRFPGCRPRPLQARRDASEDQSDAQRTAEAVVDAAQAASPPFADADLARRFLALRRLQAAFEISGG